ncbi:hypothetical protein R3P38DRAFT_2775403 [Favolaschia claudopus]|uniref:Uncharacterized protein n=1 Tax=Favolaschia claudopus TaxID=2862362 RepID=A0AAW0BV34_9AGAR
MVPGTRQQTADAGHPEGDDVDFMGCVKEGYCIIGLPFEFVQWEGDHEKEMRGDINLRFVLYRLGRGSWPPANVGHYLPKCDGIMPSISGRPGCDLPRSGSILNGLGGHKAIGAGEQDTMAQCRERSQVSKIEVILNKNEQVSSVSLFVLPPMTGNEGTQRNQIRGRFGCKVGVVGFESKSNRQRMIVFGGSWICASADELNHFSKGDGFAWLNFYASLWT